MVATPFSEALTLSNAAPTLFLDLGTTRPGNGPGTSSAAFCARVANLTRGECAAAPESARVLLIKEQLGSGTPLRDYTSAAVIPWLGTRPDGSEVCVCNPEALVALASLLSAGGEAAVALAARLAHEGGHAGASFAYRPVPPGLPPPAQARRLCSRAAFLL